jgi:hypothetical protein
MYKRTYKVGLDVAQTCHHIHLVYSEDLVAVEVADKLVGRLIIEWAPEGSIGVVMAHMITVREDGLIIGMVWREWQQSRRRDWGGYFDLSQRFNRSHPGYASLV